MDKTIARNKLLKTRVTELLTNSTDGVRFRNRTQIEAFCLGVSGSKEEVQLKIRFVNEYYKRAYGSHLTKIELKIDLRLRIISSVILEIASQ